MRISDWSSDVCSSDLTLSRAFSNDPDNVIERSRPAHRTDAQFNIQQSLWDFGAAEDRIKAAHARLGATTQNIDDSASQVAIEAIGAWYDVFGYGGLVQQIGRASGRERE